MHYELVPSRTTPDEWRVEGIDEGREGQVYVAIFSGPEARTRAQEYAAWKSARQEEPFLRVVSRQKP